MLFLAFFRSCLKLYCQCFAQSTTCGPKCRCQECNNTPNHAMEIQTARDTILERNPSAFEDKFRRGGPSLTSVGPPVGPHVLHPPTHSPMWSAAGDGGAPPPPSSSSSGSSLRYPVQHVVDTNGYPKAYYVTTTQGGGGGGHYQHHHMPPEPHQSHHHVGSHHHQYIVSRSPKENASGCKCRKSFCLKKYCECFQNQVYCGSNCRCSNCKNFPPPMPPGGNHPSSAPTAASTSSSSPIHHHHHHYGSSFTKRIMNYPATASGPHAFSRPVATSMGAHSHVDSVPGLEPSVLQSGRCVGSASSSPTGVISRPMYSCHDTHQPCLQLHHLKQKCRN
jgi:Tesmin/TSO1-like CXC domain, cysteine-rich domain